MIYRWLPFVLEILLQNIILHIGAKKTGLNLIIVQILYPRKAVYNTMREITIIRFQ